MTEEQAIEKAAALISEGGRYPVGKFLVAGISPDYERETWEVEFTQFGEEDRSDTWDPSSVIVAVDNETGEATMITLM